ncbi:MAG: Rieske 2Fe-2S domain-containing protein [Pseudomonadaceae bacterium]|nr:Rieske 2Fe-2S domain-containing protein [Pseudomonadaceae bacterium]
MPAVMPLAALSEGQQVAINVAGVDILLRLDAGRLLAVANRCPHAGAALQAGQVTDGVLTCPRHGARIDLASGRCLTPQGLPSLQTFTTYVEAGKVHIEMGGGS